MNFWQYVQSIGSVGGMLLTIKFRNYLRNENRFTQFWNIFSSLIVGCFLGGVVDAAIIPDRMGLFLLTVFLGAIIYSQSSSVKEVKE